jgi:hypothetical protein
MASRSLNKPTGKATVRGGSGSLASDDAAAAVSPPNPPRSSTEIAARAAAETLRRPYPVSAEEDAVMAELSDLLSAGKQGEVISALFCMGPLETNEPVSLRVVVIQRVALQTPSHDAEEYAAFCSWMKWLAVLFVCSLLSLLVGLIAAVFGPISLVLCMVAGIYAPSASSLADADARSNRTVELAKIGSSILSFSYFIVALFQNQSFSDAFDGTIDWMKFLRSVLLVLVVLLRKMQSAQQSFASLLTVASMFLLLWIVRNILIEIISIVADDVALAHNTSESGTIVVCTTAFAAAGITWLTYPPLHAKIQKLLNCIYLRPSLWRITGGPRQFPPHEPFRSLPVIARALELREMHRPETHLAVGHFSIEFLLKHCAFIGLASWYNSITLRARCYVCFNLLQYTIQIVLLISSVLVFFNSGIPDLRSKCDNDKRCKDFIEWFHHLLDHDCIVNAAYFVAPHLVLFQIPFGKLISETAASLALAFFWLRPALEPLLHVVVICLVPLKKLWAFVQKMYEQAVEVVVPLVQAVVKPFAGLFSKFKAEIFTVYDSTLWSLAGGLFTSAKRFGSKITTSFSLPISLLRRVLESVSAMFSALIGKGRVDAATKNIATDAAIKAGENVVKVVNIPFFRRLACGIRERLMTVTVQKWFVRLLKVAIMGVVVFLALALLHSKMHPASPHGLQ